MDKQLIERTVIELAASLKWDLDQSEKTDMIDFATRFLARIDAERGKGAVAFRLTDGDDVEYNGIDQFSCGRTGGEPLFLSPTITEGMALVPVEPTAAMVVAGVKRMLNKDDPTTEPYNIYKAMLAAAQGERNAD